jgi:Kelch motif
MAPEIRDQLRRAARRPRGDLDPAALRRRVRQLRRRRLGSMAAAVALLALLASLGQAGLERLREPIDVMDRPVGPPPTAPTVTTRPAIPAGPRRIQQEANQALSRLRPGWTNLPPPPEPRTRAVSLWIGTHLFFWGGDSGNAGTRHADGWLFDPVARRWRAIAPSPLTGRSLAGAVWTGDQVLVWGGSANDTTSFNDGAAYDPATDTWRMLPAAPLSARVPVATAWTGKELVMWGDTSRDGTEVRDGAAFDPTTQRWRTIAAAPAALNQAGAVWTGRELIVLGSRLDTNNASSTPHVIGLAYLPATDAWRELPMVELSPQASTVAWTGSSVLAWDYLLGAALYDPTQDRWHQLPNLPLEESECYPDSAANDRVVFARYCGEHALWDSQSGKWIKVKEKGFAGQVVAAGPVFLFAGATHESDVNRLTAYNPR